MIGKSKAIELMVTGNTFSFEEALELGIVNQVIDATPEEWWEQVMDYARQFVPAEQGLEGRRPHQALRPERLGPPARVGPRRRARAPAASLPERRRQGRHRREPGEAGPEVPGQVSSLKTDLFIDGAFSPAASGKRFATVNPATGETIAEVAEAGKADLDRAVAGRAQGLRVGPLGGDEAAPARPDPDARRELLLSRADEFGKLETQDNGKPIFEAAKIDMPAAAECLSYFGEYADKLYGDTFPGRPDAFLMTLREPVGVVGAITPWNFPLLQAMWKIAPALALGNAVVLKPASATPLTALALRGAPRPRRGCPRAPSRSCRARARSSGRRWPSTPASTRSPSPARPRRARRSSAPPPEP